MTAAVSGPVAAGFWGGGGCGGACAGSVTRQSDSERDARRTSGLARSRSLGDAAGWLRSLRRWLQPGCMFLRRDRRGIMRPDPAVPVIRVYQPLRRLPRGRRLALTEGFVEVRAVRTRNLTTGRSIAGGSNRSSECSTSTSRSRSTNAAALEGPDLRVADRPAPMGHGGHCSRLSSSPRAVASCQPCCLRRSLNICAHRSASASSGNISVRTTSRSWRTCTSTGNQSGR